METLNVKAALIVGDKNSQIQEIESELRAHGIIIYAATCDSVTPELINDLSIDVVISNQLHDGEQCVAMLAALRNSRTVSPVPVFALVADDTTVIQTTLEAGVADYFTSDETLDVIVQKILSVFNEHPTVSPLTDIDITPRIPNLSKSGIRVYLVEDDPLLRNLLAIRFEKSNFPYETSSDANGALSAMEHFKPNLIILDLMLPGKSGFEILAEVRENVKLKNTPVIVFSNRDSTEDRKKATELGAVGFYVKAMTDLSELVEKIEQLAK